MNQCKTCGACLHNDKFVVQYGESLSQSAMNAKVCQYGRKKSDNGCLNPCTIVNKEEEWEFLLNKTKASIHPEMRSLINFSDT